MKLIGKFFIGLFTAFFCFAILSFARFGLQDKSGFLLVSFIGPFLIPLIFLFLPSIRKALGAAFFMIGISLMTMPIGLREIVSETGHELTEAETQTTTEEVAKSVMLNVFDSIAAGFLWFGPLTGAFLLFAGYFTWKSE